MSENENVGIELGVDADAALETFQQLATAARAADTDIQALKEQLNTLTSQVTTGATTPEIAQTRQALNARRAEVQGQALDFVGTNPQVVAQPLPDTLAQFQQAMAAREQQQQAQRERQAQQQAAGIERPARYGYDQSAPLAPSHASSIPTPLPLPPAMQATGTGPMTPAAPLATTSDERLAHALSAQAPTGTSAPGRAAGTRDNDNAPMGDFLPAESGRSSPAPATVQPVAPLAASGDDRLTQALTVQSPVAPASAPVAALAGDGASPDASAGDVAAPVAPASVPLAVAGDDRLARALTATGQSGVPTPPPVAADAGVGSAGTDVAGPLPQTFAELAAAARGADTELQDLKQRLLDLFNAIPRGAQPEAASYDDAVGRLQQIDPSLVAQLHPAIATTWQSIQGRQTDVAGQVRDFAADNPDAAAEPLPTQQDMLTRWQDLLRQHNEQQQATAAAGQGPDNGQVDASQAPNTGSYYRQSVRSGPLVPPPPEGMERLARYGVYGATVDQRGAANPWPAATPAFGPMSGGANSNDTTQQDRSDTVLGDHIAQALTRSAGGLVAGGINGAANAAGMGATGDLVAGLARPLMAMVSAPLAIAAGVIGGVAGVGLGVNSLQSRYAGEQQTLAGSVGTATGATPSSELTTAQNAGWSMMYHEAQSVAAAQQLGDAGVQSGQLGAGLTASMALSRVGGIGLDQTTALTGQMMQSGMSGNQVGDMYAQMDQAARQSGVSLGRLVDGIKALNQASGVGQISVNGLAAAQALAAQTGTNIDIARAMSGTVGATGTGALAQGALLGLNPAQFEAAQRDPAKLWDAYANTARRYDVGSGGERVAQQALSTAGFDFSGMKGPQADEFIRRLVSEGPGAAQKYEQSLQQKEAAPGAPGPHNFDELTKAAAHAATDITNAGDQLQIKAEQAGNALVRGGEQAARDLAGRDPRYTKSGTDLSAGPNSHHIQPTRVLQGDSTLNLPPPSASDLGINPNAIDFTNPTALAHQANRNQASWDAHNQALLQDNLAHNRAGDASQFGYDASGDAAFGAISGTAVNQGMAGQLKVGGAGLSASTFSALEAAASRTGVPLSVLLAPSRQEATVNGKIDPSAVSADGGYGLGQFTDQASALKYLGQASHELGKGPVTAANWHQAALNPQIAAQGMADYDASLVASKSAGGRWDKALAQYNAGPAGWDYTGHPGQGRDYGAGVVQGAQQVQHTLGITVTVQDQNGNKVGQTKTQHNVDTSRKVVAAQSYGPMDNQSPTVGLPLQLPRPIK